MEIKNTTLNCNNCNHGHIRKYTKEIQLNNIAVRLCSVCIDDLIDKLKQEAKGDAK
jgi:hypothetical protein